MQMNSFGLPPTCLYMSNSTAMYLKQQVDEYIPRQLFHGVPKFYGKIYGIEIYIDNDIPHMYMRMGNLFEHYFKTDT